MTQDPFAPGPGSTPGGYGPPPGQYAGSPYGPPHGQHGAGPYGPPTGQHGGGYGPPGPAGRTSLEPKAWIALLCAVLAWTPTIPFLGAIAALFLARSARRDILASGGRLTGLSLCTWAVVMSWVHLVFVALLFLLLLVLLAVGLALPFGLSSL
jgi:hypothetical protein